MHQKTFRNSEKLLTKRDFLPFSKEYANKGSVKKRTTEHFIVRFLANKKNKTRLGLAIRAKQGGAVLRNRAKRLLREFFRLNKKDLPESIDIFVILKNNKDIKELSFRLIKKELTVLFK